MLLYTLPMAKTAKIQDLTDFFLGDVSEEMLSQDEIKFDLYLKARELRQLSEYLEKVLLRSAQYRQRWIQENRPVLESLLKVFSEDSNLSLAGIQLDAEAASLSMELAVSLRQTVAMINALFYSNDGLRS
jgi:hypothetical protein